MYKEYMDTERYNKLQSKFNAIPVEYNSKPFDYFPYSEYLYVWLYQLLVSKPKIDRDGVLHRVCDKFTGQMDFDSAVKRMIFLIKEEAKKEVGKTYPLS